MIIKAEKRRSNSEKAHREEPAAERTAQELAVNTSRSFTPNGNQ